MSKQNYGAKGTQDIFPDKTHIWQYVEETASMVASLYGYKEIRVPMFEHTEVFTGSVGESSDIVQKEMYTFTDKGDRSITLRPEMTAGVTRSIIEHGLLNNSPLPLKLFYIGSCFRYERPQAGRFREFHQFGVESYGSNNPANDAELILMVNEFFTSLGIENYTLKLNSIGCPECRPNYTAALKDYFRSHMGELDEDSIKRIETNPMRILDTKVKTTRAIVDKAPKITDYLCDDCKEHFATLTNILDNANMTYEFDPDLVRGLDYYTNTVFEFISHNLGAKSTICGGGRYNLLVEERGGPKTPAAGFGIGLERLILELEAIGANIPETETCDIYVGSAGSDGERKIANKKAFALTNMFRENGIYAECDLMDRSVKAQMKYANKINAKYTLMIGEDELLNGKGNLRDMETGGEAEISLDEKALDQIYDIQVARAIKDIDEDNLF